MIKFSRSIVSERRSTLETEPGAHNEVSAHQHRNPYTAGRAGESISEAALTRGRKFPADYGAAATIITPAIELCCITMCESVSKCAARRSQPDNNLFPDIKKLGHCRVAAGNGNHHCGETAASSVARTREETDESKL